MLVVTGETAMATLGILIITDSHAKYVREIVHAAHHKGHLVRIHLTGSGVKVAGSTAFEPVGAWAKITICRQSAEKLGLTEDLERRYPHILTDDESIADVILGCDRHLVL